MSTKAVVQATEGLSRNPPKNFSKLKLFQLLGILDRKLNFETLELEPSLSLRLWCYLALIAKLIFGFKLILSSYWPKNHVAQLFIGRYKLVVTICD